ncbi:MAG: hypothetical protein LBS46_02730 [Dysgonamonadaceae bacterium]|jgi:hypothetical protein|nr:hypothetical protein [Dysgonamonadaceae bacterium]
MINSTALRNVICFVSLVCLTSMGVHAQSSGSGTVEDPYIIANEGDLQSIYQFATTDASDGVYFSITEDITLTESWNNYVIGPQSAHPFKGKVAGNGHTISGLSINKAAPAAGYLGYYALFGVIGSGAEITDLHVQGSISIDEEGGSAYAAGLVARIYSNVNATDSIIIRHCSSAVDIVNNATTAYTGGVVGYSLPTAQSQIHVLIDGCANTGNLSGPLDRAGGIIASGLVQLHDALQSSLTLSNCYNSGNITTTETGDNYVGGIAGYFGINNALAGPATIEKCLNTGILTGTSLTRLAGILARIMDWENASAVSILRSVAAQTSISCPYSSGPARVGYKTHSTNGVYKLSKNYALESMLVNGAALTSVYLNTSSQGRSKTLEELQDQNFYVDTLAWDFTGNWAIDATTLFPMPKYMATPLTSIKEVSLARSLSTAVIDGVLKVQGLKPGETVIVYTATGVRLHQAQVRTEEAQIALPASGVYIVKAGNRTAKVIR